MNLLLDTHIVLLSLNEPQRLDPRQKAAIESPENQVWVSSISIWEIVIKSQLGKLKIPGEFAKALESQGFELLPFSADDGLDVLNLPTHHHDPFDRALIAQARVNRLHLVSADQMIRLYGNVVDLLT